LLSPLGRAATIRYKDPVQWLEQVGDAVVRAVVLLGLAAAPPWLSPEPGPMAAWARVIAALFLVAYAYALMRLRVRMRGVLARLGLVLLGAAALAAIAFAFVRGATGPLGSGVFYVAPPLWAGLGFLAAALAERRLGQRFRRVRPIALVLVLLTGATLMLRAPWLVSREQSWLEVLRRDPQAIFAVEALLRGPLDAKAYDAANGLVEACFSAAPDGCACHAGRAEIAMRRRPASSALVHARAAAERCPESAGVRAALAEALVLDGEADLAEHEARAALTKGSTARLHHVLAMALDRQGRSKEAIEEAKRAIGLGAGRDSVLLLGALWLSVGDLEQATKTLQPLVTTDPRDAAALYNLALIADRQGDYNRARQGYLAALRADPGFASARYNLAVLAHRHNIREEARHHAQTFVASFPEDPRGAELMRTMSGGQAAGER
jgi:tetratricopeptide (TPR) repeat protein